MASLMLTTISLPPPPTRSRPYPPCRSFSLRSPTLNYSSQFRLPTNSVFLPRLSISRIATRRTPPFSLRRRKPPTASMKPPGKAVETDRLPSDVRRRAMDAVDSLGGRVTMGDVASKAGLKLDESLTALQALASDTDAFLEVSNEGDVLYVFPRDYRSKLTAKSTMIKLEPLFGKTKSAAGYLVRFFFGAALIASIILICIALFVLLMSLKSNDDDNDDDDKDKKKKKEDSGSTFNFTSIDFFGNNCSQKRESRDLPQKTKNENDEGMGFIDSVFSFVFGDGDPNQGIEQERWKLIGGYISSNGGVVTAEELAPYLDVDTSNIPMNDETYTLPVLLRFGGQPEVDEEGYILYRFPSLQRTASSQRIGSGEYVGREWSQCVGGVETFFKEKKWQFSKTGKLQRAMVIVLGAFNLCGLIILGALLNDPAVTSTEFITFVSNIFPLLQIYAGSFFAIPIIRCFLIRNKNAKIENRNRAREQRARVLELPDIFLRHKLLSARDMSRKNFIGQDQIIYSTEKDLLEQNYDAQEWDGRFQQLNRSE